MTLKLGIAQLTSHIHVRSMKPISIFRYQNFYLLNCKFEKNNSISDNFWSAFCVFHAYFWEKTHIFKICALKKRNDFRQLKRSNFRVEKCKTEENVSKFLNKMAYKTLTSMRDCVMKRNFMLNMNSFLF